MSSNEIVIYKSEDQVDFQIPVRIEDETVWLTQLQMVELFEGTKQNISLHINNIFKEDELNSASVVKEYLTVQLEGNRKIQRKILYYNLDVIISVGYRIKSQRGTKFRIWANKVLKDYLLKGYVLNQRVDRIKIWLSTIKNLICSLKPIFHQPRASSTMVRYLTRINLFQILLNQPKNRLF